MKAILTSLFLILNLFTVHSVAQSVDPCKLLSLDMESRLGVLGGQKTVKREESNDLLVDTDVISYSCEYSTKDSRGSVAIKKFAWVADVNTQQACNAIDSNKQRVFKAAKDQAGDDAQISENPTDACFAAQLVPSIVITMCVGYSNNILLGTITFESILGDSPLGKAMLNAQVFHRAVTARLVAAR